MRSVTLLSILFFVSFSIFAQKTQSYDQYIEDELIDYSLLLKYKDSINLTESQITKLKAYYENNDFDFNKSSKAYEQSMLKLKSAVDKGMSREDVMSVFSDVLVLESEIKRNKLGFLLHSREILTDNQRKQLRLIGRSNQLTIKPNADGYFGSYFSEIKPLYKIVNPNGTEVYIKDPILSKINYGDIQSIDVDKDVDLELDGFKLLNQNVITIKTNRDISNQKIRLEMRGYASAVDFSMQPLIIIKLRGKTKTLDNVNLREKVGGLDPDEIKSIEVIKGEKALSLYGSKGKPGVIVITLKDNAKYDI
ncbi:MAG: hypothetical protein AAFQ94_30140 [Bacteroidota bacterium]